MTGKPAKRRKRFNIISNLTMYAKLKEEPKKKGKAGRN